MARKRSPEDRSAQIEKDRQRVRRSYRQDTSKGRKIRLGETEAITNQVVIFTIAGYTPTQIARIIGISRGKVKGILDEPNTQALMVDTRHGLTKAAYDLLESYGIEAVQSIVDIMRGSEDDSLVLKAAAEILDRSGLPKASRSEQKIHKTNEELTTISNDGIVERLREMSPEVAEEAAALVEQLEGILEKAAAEGEEAVDEQE